MTNKGNKGKPSVEKPWLKYYSKYIIDSKIPELTIYDYLKEGNKDYLSRTAINYFNRLITYKELIKSIDIVAESFRNRGVKKGDIVTISTPTLPETIYIFYALSKIGAISNMIDPRKSFEEIKEYTESVNSKYLFIVDVAYDKVKDLKNEINLKEVFIMSPGDSLPTKLKRVYKMKSIKSVPKKSNDEVTLWKDFYSIGKERIKYLTDEETKGVPYVKDTSVVIVYTGGTTGLSKGVVLTNDNVNAAAYQCIHCGFDFQRQHKWLNIMPPFIAYGIGNGLHLPLVCGMEVILVPKFDAKKFDRLLLKHKPNHMTGVPTHYDSVVSSEVLKNESLKFIYSAIVGGDKLDEGLERKINEYFDAHNCNYKIAKGYGLSEVMAAVCATSKNIYNELGSVGIPFSHTVISIFNPENGEELTYNEVGEVCIAGPNIMKGYYNNEKETNNIIRTHEDGTRWVHSGDLGYMDSDGKIFIVGRTKEVIIRHDGFKVYPITIENVISSHPAVEVCKVIGIKDNTFSQGELPKAYVVLNKNIKYDETEIKEELKELCEERLAEYLQPCDFEFKEELPLTLIGKVDFVKLKKENE